MSPLKAISPIDGRYHKTTLPLSRYFSEVALIKYRIIVEGEYLIALSEEKKTRLRKFSEAEKSIIRGLYSIKIKDAEGVKNFEATTNHDVKAIEYFIKERLKNTSLADVLEWIHFALTSEDVNNLSYALMLSESLRSEIIPYLNFVLVSIDHFAQSTKNIPMLARTHGQSASPTTLGKEFKVFSSRLKRQIDQLKKYRILVKLNGAAGNYNAHLIAYPKIDWPKFTQNFIMTLNTERKIRLEANLVTTQIEPHDTYAELFDIMRRINTNLIDFDQDVWRYISDGWLNQKPKEVEIGSSTMPHKINPIDFENSEGNLGMANALFTYFSSKLPISRLQRDLSDSTVERNFGIALAHSFIAYQAIQKGLSKISPNRTKILEDLENHYEVIAEGIQTILRRENVAMPYEALKNLTRGKKVTRKDFQKFIDKLKVSEKIKKELRRISPRTYIGLAEKLSLF